MTELPKAYVIGEFELNKLKDVIANYRPREEVAVLVKEIRHTISYPAMWVGRKSDYDSLLLILMNKFSWLTYLCQSRSYNDYLDTLAFGANGIFQLKERGEYPDKVLKAESEFYQDLEIHFGNFLEWIPNNLILAKKNFDFPEYQEAPHSCKGLPLDALKDHTDIKAFRQELVQILAKSNGKMTHVYTEGFFWSGSDNFTIPHLTIIALNRPVNQENSGAKTAKALGFVDE